jgi:hypothetical protein
MPARDLYRRLLELCEGRVARSDRGWAADAGSNATEKKLKNLATPAEWTRWRTAQKKAETSKKVAMNGDLSIDYTLK